MALHLSTGCVETGLSALMCCQRRVATQRLPENSLALARLGLVLSAGAGFVGSFGLHQLSLPSCWLLQLQAWADTTKRNLKDLRSLGTLSSSPHLAETSCTRHIQSPGLFVGVNRRRKENVNSVFPDAEV